MRVLLIEDDPMIGRAVVAGLQDAGYTVDWVRDGAEAELALGHRVYDLALLDLGLPRRDGVDILKGMRRGGSQLPVLIITARDALADRVAGLDLGADDYLVKPFDLDELLARARAVMRRKSGRSTPDMACGALTVDPVRREVTFRGAPVELSAREFDVLHLLMSRAGQVVSRYTILDEVWDGETDLRSNVIDVHLASIRAKIDRPFGISTITTVRGAGYRVDP